MKYACVIGWGTVGRATAEAFGIEDYFSRSSHNITLEEAATRRYIFICLPTPTIDGECYVKDILDAVGTISSQPNYDPKNIFIIRSTVTPGFNRLLRKTFGVRVVSNPEFLSEDTAVEDALRPDLVVLGSDETADAEAIRGLYAARFKYAPVMVTDSVTAEMIKYTLNTFFATKVIFANEIYDYAQKVHANYETIKHVLQHHKWGSKNHFAVHYKGKRGVHGKCLPKDTENMATQTQSPFFKMLLERNEVIKNER